MKTKLLSLCAVLSLQSAAMAGVLFTPSGVSVSGIIEGSASNPIYRGDTIDYLTFEVTTRGPIRLIASGVDEVFFLALGRVVELGLFGLVLPNYLLFPSNTSTPAELTRILDPGLYVVQMAEEEYRGGDLGPGFVPANRLGGGFDASPYRFEVEGAFTPVDFLEGNLNGTFTVTHVPEPSTLALSLATLTACLTFRRRAK